MAKVETIRSILSGGHRLGVARVREVAELILARPRKVPQLVECLWDPDPGVANRAADALERASFRRPELLALWKDSLLGLLAEARENKLRWNLALMVPRLNLSKTEIGRAAGTLRTYLEDSSSIVKTAAMHGLAGLALQDPSLKPEVLDLLHILSRSATPAMRARGRILLEQLDAEGKKAVRKRKPDSPRG